MRVSPRRPSELDQALLQRLEHRLTPGMHFELAIDALDMARHGLARHPEMACDLGIAEALADAPQTIDFPGRQLRRVQRHDGPSVTTLPRPAAASITALSPTTLT